MGSSERHSFVSQFAFPPDYLDRCVRALERALYQTPAYQDWRSLDPGPGSPVFARLAALSALTKRELRFHGPQGFVPGGRDLEQALAKGEVEFAHTSGTTSDRVTNVWHQTWWNASEAASWRLNAHANQVATGGHREAILTSPGCAGFSCEDSFLTAQERTLGRFLFLSERSDPSAWPESMMDRMVDELNLFRPVIIEANPSFLARLSRHIVRRRLRVTSPSLIVLTYENPSILHLRQIRRVFESPIASSYGSTETGYVFMQCEGGRLHQITENCHVDFLPFLPEHGGPDKGRILVTTFENPWQSLLRFDIGDVVRLDGRTPCSCGRHQGLTLASVEGRTVNLTTTSDGRAVTQGDVDRTLADVSGLVEYQLFQTGLANYRLCFVAEDIPSGRVAGEILERLQSLYGPDAVITTKSVASIPPDHPGKYRLTRSLEPVDSDVFLDSAYKPNPS